METLKHLTYSTETYFIDDLSRSLIRRNCLNSDGQYGLDLYLKKQYNSLIKYDLSNCLRLNELKNVLDIMLGLGEYKFPKKKSLNK